MAAITLKGVTKAYGDHAPVLHGIDLDIGENEFCVFLGPSGCGKSTLLRIIAGLEDATSGDVEIGGRLVNAIPPAKRGVAMVFQSYALFPHMTVEENMGFGLKLSGLPADQVAAKVRTAAKTLQLDALLKRKPAALSGGQRQRVAIGRAIVREPGVFLFDEPLSNLDAMLRSQTRVEIAKLHRKFAQSSTVYVTHDQVEAMTLGDKIVLLRTGADAEQFGSIAQVGSPLDLYHRPNSRFVAEFIGSPKMNFLGATIKSLGRDGVIVRLEKTNEDVLVRVDGSSLQTGQAVQLGIRPEHFDDVIRGNLIAHNDEDAVQTLQREVTLVERLGEHSYLHLDDLAGATIVVKQPGDVAYQPGTQVTIRFNSNACHLFTADGSALPKLH
ncbi:Maltose/maltodextrin import ATP-binding protein MalK [Paraburkholderia hiiakae]|uniref:Maltose/maltodextrin import ATP-binding protein MalK n=1 Tax=Paraburkholderia hiiakae TaxID=1081782 RepID=A0ABM8NMU2_9BURK|nr:ATP-binding cassette domain-containing protein [Paraburkholderia hiiakae]CAD6533810.1 Maltose/maltodextrin import ATP-binding protein MalK [Paraburkholderia hiiakae]